MAISPQQLTIYLYSAHRAVIFAIASFLVSFAVSMCHYGTGVINYVFCVEFAV